MRYPAISNLDGQFWNIRRRRKMTVKCKNKLWRWFSVTLLMLHYIIGCQSSKQNYVPQNQTRHQQIKQSETVHPHPSHQQTKLQQQQQQQSQQSASLRVKTGFEDFKELLLRSDVFVDKSIFIDALLAEPTKVTLITRPRKWGKSINMDMLKRFLEIEIDQNGVPLPDSEKLNNRLFVGGTANLGNEGMHAFKPLKIVNHTSTMKQMGKYPVISISFKFVKGYGIHRISQGVKKELIRMFKRHTYLKPRLNDEQKRLFDVYLSGNYTDYELRNSVSFLSDLLYKHFNKNVVILIDDYDTPIISSYWELMENKVEMKMILKFFQNFYTSSLNSPYIHKGVLTGLLKLAATGLFSEVNSKVERYPTHSKKFSKYFGFTEIEVDELLAKVNTSTEPSEIKKFYNGFTWADNVLFNPLSIMTCLQKDGILDTYWMDSGSSLTIDVRVFKGTFAAELPLLESKGIFMYQIYDEINLIEIFEGFKEMWFSLLVSAGYLNVVEDVDYQGDSGYRLSFPNQEIKEQFVPKVLKWVFYDQGDCIVSISM